MSAQFKAKIGKFWLIPLIAVCFLLLATPSTFAATGINKQINFQGKVVNANGTNVANGNYDFIFSIYTVASAGTAVWTETRTGANQVAVTDGIFRVSLGSITALPGSIDFNTDNIYLSINFNSDGEMTPRVQFTAVPQAFNALKVAGLTVTDTTGTFTLAAAKTLTVNNTLTFAGTDSTSFTFPSTSGGTVITSNTPSQTVTSTQTSGTVLGVTDSNAITAAIIGQSITLSGTGAFDQTGLQFSLSGASGTNLNDVLGSGSTWKVSRAGVGTFTSGTVLGSQTFTTNSIADSGGLTIASGGAGNLTLNSAGGTLSSNATTVTFGSATAVNLAANSAINPNASGTISLGTGANTTGVTMGRAATTTTFNSTAWTATPTISGLITATSGVSVAANQSYTGVGAVTVSSGGSSDLTIDSASSDITIAANDTITFGSGTGTTNVTLTAGTGGTTTGLIVIPDTTTASRMITATTGTLNNAVGVALTTASIGSSVRVAVSGVVSTIADNTVAIGDFIGLGTTTAGRAKSLGTTYPSTSGVQVIGRALTSAVAGGSFNLMLTGLENNVSAGGSGYATIQDEATGLTQRSTVNFIGTGITCVDNAGSTRTDCTVSSTGGGVSFATGTSDNTTTSNNLIHLQKSGVNKFIVANNGGLSIFGATANVAKTTTGTTNATDFSLTGSTFTNVTSQNDTITLNEGTVPASGQGTMATSPVVTSAAAGAGAQSIQREGGRYIIIHGNSLATGSSWDGSSTTMTSVTVATGATNPGAGAIALKRPDGRYLIVHGNASAGLTSLFDPRGVTTIAAGPAVCGGGAATTGTNAFLRQDGKYVILCGNLTAWGVYDPTANTYTAGTAVGTAFGAGAHAIQRDHGTFLVFRGANTTNHWIYNPFASATGTMTADPIVSAAPTITTGAFSMRRYDGKFLVMGGAVNTSAIYDPTGTSANSGAGSMTAQSGVGFGPTAALADGAQAIRRQDGKYIMIVGAGSTVTNIIDPSVSTSSQFIAGAALPGAPGAGVHIVMRPNGQMQIIRGGATTTTDNYDTGYIIGGNGTGVELASYETECITTTSLNTNSRLFWNANQEGQMTYQVKTGTGACSGSYKDMLQSGDLIRPTAGDNRVQVKVFFKRSLPNFVDQGWGLWRGLGQVQYRRVALDPTLYDITVDNSNMVHRTQFEFGNSSDPSGPAAINMTNDRDKNLAIALAMGVGYGSTINATNPQFYNGAFGTHTALATSATAGTVVMRRPDGKFMVVAGNTTTANAQLYDPVAQTFTAQSGAGNIPTAGSGLGALAIKKPDGKYLLVIGNATTTTNIYDPLGATGSQFVAGPALTAVAGRGALTIPLPNGRVLILHGNFTSTSSIYDPIQNTIVAGPTPSAVIGGGAMAIPRPNGTFFVVLGIATEACTALNTTTNNFDPYTMVFTAAGSPAITTGVGPGAFTFQRTDGQWVIVHGGGTITTCAGVTRTQIYNPLANTSVVGPVLLGVAQHGAHAMQRPDGTWLVVHGGALTTTSMYLEKKGAFTTEGLAGIGQFIAGPALVTAASAGSISFQRDDGKFVTITGNAGTVMQEYDAGWVASGIYKSEQLNVVDLDSNSTLTWRGSPTMTGISAEVRTAPSQLGLQTATAREIPTSGGLINPGGSETWLQINFNFKRTFPSYGGMYTDTWYNGGSPNHFRQRQIDTPTLTEFKVNKDVNLVDLKSDGLSVFRVSSSGDIFTGPNGVVNSGGADLAENYTSQVPLEKGEVVAIDPQNNHGVMRSKYQYQPDVLGVVSTAPGFVAGSYTKDSYPIALVGRVPVKVSTENGSIRVGDRLTASSVPGHAMKATFSGRVLGSALENLEETTLVECPVSDIYVPGRKCGEIMMFVNLIDYMGAPVEVVMGEKAQSSVLGLSENGQQTTDNSSKQDQILAFLRQLKEEQENQLATQSEIFTNRVSAVNEIISPLIVTDLLLAKKIKADSIEGLEILTHQISRLRQDFDGQVKIKDQNEALAGQIADVATASAGLSSEVKLDVVEFESGKFILDLTVLGKLNADGGLAVFGLSEFKGESIFEKLVTFLSEIIFKGKVSFTQAPIFNRDTAGFALIKKGEQKIKIEFEKEYNDTPIITVNKIWNRENDTLSVIEKRDRFFLPRQDYVVADVTTKGFTIVLEEPAVTDLKFSWIALAVKEAKIFENSSSAILEESVEPVISATDSPTPTLTQLNNETISPSPSQPLTTDN